MKKLCGLMLVCVMVVMLTLTLAYTDRVQIPAPFAKAKAIAMAVEPDSQARYLAIFEWNENGTDFVYVFGYMPNYNLIGIGNLAEGWVIEFHTDTGEITVWTPMGRFPVAKEEMAVAIDKAFEVFRILVAKGLI